MSALLTPQRLTVYPWAIVVLFVLVWGLSLRTAFAFPDYLARWTAGSLVLDGRGAHLYDPGAQSDIQAALGATKLSWFVSPPFVAVVFAPLALLPYGPSAGLWLVISMALLAWSARTASTMHPRLAALGTRRGLLVAASCQPVLELLGAGQDSALVLAALVGGAVQLQRGNQVWAGFLLSVTVVKPQLAVLVPVALVWQRAWRAVAGALGGGAALILLATAVLGPGVWNQWRAALLSPLYAGEVISGQSWKNSSGFGLVENIVPGDGGPVVVALWVGISLWVLGAGWRARQRAGAVTRDPLVLIVGLPLATVLLTPHAMVYDLVIVIPTVTYLCAPTTAHRARGLSAVGFVLLFLAPLAHLVALRVPVIAVIGAPWVVVVLLLLWKGLVDPDVEIDGADGGSAGFPARYPGS